jgi:hypothetical protein
VSKWVFVLMCAALVWGSAVSAEASEKPLSDKTIYKADVRIDPQTKRVTGRVEIQFWPKDEKRAYLHLYPYAFTAKQQGALWDELLGKEAAVGTYDSTKLSVQGKPAATKRTGTILEVPLDTAARSGAVHVKLDFEMKLPHNDGRMSYDDHALWLGNWLPILAVHDQAGWHLDPYVPVGDPFYSETADYEVQISLPDPYQLASTATDRAAVVDTSIRGQKTYKLQAANVRDFALIIMDGSYQKLETQVGNTKVRTWWRKTDDAQQAKKVHDAAAQSLEYFSSQFGTYPYTEYDVVRTGGWINGMEYPALVFLDGRHFLPGGQSGQGALATVVHETAHQWFYGMIGNNQVEEAWLDEGLTEYASLAFLSAKYPKVGADRVVGRMIKGTSVQIYVESKLSPWQSLLSFPDNQSYIDLVYSRTTSMLWMLREAWGEERFHEVLRQYVADNRFGIANGKEWREMVSQAAGEDASAFFDYWLHLDLKQKDAAAAWLARQEQKLQEKTGK